MESRKILHMGPLTSRTDLDTEAPTLTAFFFSCWVERIQIPQKAKRHLNGASLADQCAPTLNVGLVVL